jgi:hypothetical protein
MFVNRHPKFLDALNGIEQKFGIQFSPFPIDRIESQLFNVEEIPQILFQLNKELIEILRSMDAVDNESSSADRP